jgi:hypothetical protein
MGFFDQLPYAVADGHAKADTIIECLERQTEQLAHVVDNTTERSYRDKVHRLPIANVPVAAGNALAYVDAPQGIAWNLMSIAGDSAVSAAGVEVRIYLNTNDPFNLLKVIKPTDTGRWSADFPADEYVPEGGRLVVEWVGQGATVVVNANIKVETLQQRPA